MEIRHEEAGQLKSGRYMMMGGEAAEIVNIEKSAPGKHGHAKFRITSIGLLTGTKKQEIYTGHDSVEVPIIEKKTAQVLSASETTAQAMDMQTYETFEVDIPEEFRGKIEPNQEITFWAIQDKKIIKQVR